MNDKINKSQGRIRKYQQQLSVELDANKKRILNYKVQLENIKIQIEKIKKNETTKEKASSSK